MEEQEEQKRQYETISNTPTEIAKIELRQQQAEIAKLEKHIVNLNRQLNANYDINRMESKEDEYALLKAEYAALVEERELLAGVSKKNVKAGAFLKMEEAYNQKFKDLQQRVEYEKENHASLLEKIERQDKALRKLHKNIQFKEERIKEMEHRISERSKFPEKEFYITEVDIAILERKLQEMKEQHLNLDRTYQTKMRQMERDRKEKQRSADLKLMTIKELEKELKLSSLKFKELALLIRHNALPPMNSDQVTQLYKDSLPKP